MKVKWGSTYCEGFTNWFSCYEINMEFSKQMKTELPYCEAIPVLGIHLKDSYILYR